MTAENALVPLLTDVSTLVAKVPELWSQARYMSEPVPAFLPSGRNRT